ncbi:hypothetical protein EYF80_014130 [Liparis tanakae]|uniref:Uncharacterized protein n=1 Tax=Liparis tanakae TaxID=230148 RepID=A0A4Z2ICZ5_9TELE|nr:hypothetical protein EYF80_014130 [Liparis tanakae]
MKRGVYSLGSQHTVTRSFIHGRGGPSSAGSAGTTRHRGLNTLLTVKPAHGNWTLAGLSVPYPAPGLDFTFSAQLNDGDGKMPKPEASKWNPETRALLTAVVVVAPRQKLKPQGEGRESLDLLREAGWSERGVGVVTLPPLDGPSGLHAALERGLRHQVEAQRLRLPLGPRVGVVRAVNVQVVVQIHLDGQISCS